jgi:Fe(3+) dicitrate transport protein
MKFKLEGFTLVLILLSSLIQPNSHAEDRKNQENLGSFETVTIEDTSARSLTLTPPVVEDGKILSDKKVTITNIEALPPIVTNNYRQVLSQVPGLLSSEVNNESFASINYRGIGDPHESFNILLLKDGLPLAPDPYGYPASYYVPPTDSLTSTEFIRGGASLLYGPQPSGALNFVTRKAQVNTPFSFKTKQIVGSNSLYSTYNEFSEGNENNGVLASFHHRNSDGTREFNSDYQVSNGTLRSTHILNSDNKVMVDIDVYDGNHGEPGGLSNVSGEGLVSIHDDRFASTLKYDRLKIKRYISTVSLEHTVDANSSFTSKAYGGYTSRVSNRQSYGEAPSFGGIPLGTTNTIQNQAFRIVGTDNRFQNAWGTNNKNIFTFGVSGSYTDSPYNQSKGETPFATTGALEKRFARSTGIASVFTENKFQFGDLSVTPGVRFENIFQSIDEEVNTSVTDGSALRSDNRYDAIPLGGVGATYKWNDSLQSYMNFSQGYKPVTFQDSLPLQSGDTISRDLEAGKSVTSEVGLKGDLTKWATFDTSLFWTEYRNQFGRVANEIKNVGKARYRGMDAAVDVSLIKDKSLTWYSNISLLDAEFTEGPLKGKTPQFAPQTLLRSGLTYSMDKKLKLAFIGTFVDSVFADDGNSDNRFIDNYAIWDLTAEIPVYKNISLISGVNNIFDEQYTSRIRSNGLEPGNPRNYYMGLNFDL